jgi:radical SAM protein with 4Fe4S-binding SPASM domain
MDAHRWQNVTAARLSWSAGAARTADSPLQAWLEVSARCNLRCQMCAINYDSRYRPQGTRPPFFQPELFARLRPIFPRLLRAYLFGLGEPTLNPYLIDYIRELSAAGVEVAFNTNATLIDDAKAREIADAGTKRVTVSIDGAQAETYEAIRVGATFEKVMRGIRALIAAGLEVDFSMVAMKSNLDDVPRLVDLCADVGGKGVHVEPLYSQVGSPELDEHYARENLGGVPGAVDRFEDAARRASQHGIRFGSRFRGVETFDYVDVAREQRATWTCSEPWASIWVTSAGDVRTCCLNDKSFGNLNEETFEEIWNGDAYQRFREQHARREHPEGCANCILNGRVQATTFFRPTQAVTLRPYFESLPEPSADDDVILETPTQGATVVEPLTIEGRVRRGVDPRSIDVMIDYTHVEYLNRKKFKVLVPTSFLSEGAHVLWMRSRGGRGCAYREVHFWRPPLSSRA